jgi:hypothetical protein
MCVGRRTISRVIQFGTVVDEGKHFSAFYRFFSRAVWDPDELGKRLFPLALSFIPEDSPIFVTVDDTMCRKSGPHLWGGGMHHDALMSNYSGARKAVKVFSFGHNWVILCVCLPLPWNVDRVIAIPIAFRLYRSKKRCPQRFYKKRTVLAHEMIHMVSTWIPPERKVILVADTEYACETVVKDLPDNFDFVGPMNMDAAVFERPKKQKGRGRRRKKGERLASPNQLIKSGKVQWKTHKISMYGRQVEVLVKSQLCLWYRVAGTKLVRMIVTRDPKGRIADRAYFTTNVKLSIGNTLRAFSFRWTQEEMHRNVKQHLGLEDPQNGWWRREAGCGPQKKVAGPQPHRLRGQLAVERTVPFILTVYALVVLWYLACGSYRQDVDLARRWAPWYRHKEEPSFGDMLASLRRHIIAERNLRDPAIHAGSEKIDEVLVELVCSA